MIMKVLHQPLWLDPAVGVQGWLRTLAAPRAAGRWGWCLKKGQLWLCCQCQTNPTMCIPLSPPPFFLLLLCRRLGSTSGLASSSAGALCMMQKELSGPTKAGVTWSWKGPIIQRRQSPGSLGVEPNWAKEEPSLYC